MIKDFLQDAVEKRVGADTLVSAVVSDSGANYLKAARLYNGDTWACMSHSGDLLFENVVEDLNTAVGQDFKRLSVRVHHPVCQILALI
jgi:hypothetical protein